MLPLLNARFTALRITSNASRTRLAPTTATRSLFVAAGTRPVAPTHARTFLSSAAAESPAKKSTSTETSEDEPKKKATGEKKTPAKKPKKVVLEKVSPQEKKPAKPKKPVLPKIPTRTVGVYGYWLAKHFLPNYSQKLSNAAVNQQAFKDAGARWKTLTEAEKLQVKEERDAVAAEQEKVRNEVINSLSPSTLHAINRKRQAKGKAPVTIPVEKRRPRNAYLRFLDDFRKEYVGTVIEQSVEASKRWNVMSDSEKEPYVKAFEKDMAEFRAKYSE